MSLVRFSSSFLLFSIAAYSAVVDFSVLQPRSNYAAVVAGDADQSDLHLSYRTLNTDFTPFSNQVDFWNGGYSDLPVALFPDQNGKLLEITLTPIGFDKVRLNSFKVGSYSGGPQRVDSIFRVTDGASNTILFSNEPYTYVASPTAYTINVNQQAGSLKLIMGGDWDLGVNYLNYDVFNADTAGVPEPSTIALGISGLAMVLFRRKLRS